MEASAERRRTDEARERDARLGETIGERNELRRRHHVDEDHLRVKGRQRVQLYEQERTRRTTAV